jgi:hypothetical protein
MLKITLTNTLKQFSFLMVATCTVFIVASDSISAAKPLTKAEQAKDTASKQNKYTFIMFWKKKDNATSAMWKNLGSSLEGRMNQATYTQVRANDPAEANLVKKYGVSRAPMPLTLAIAPNGAVTGSFVKRINKVNIVKSFVSPAKSQCMKTLQDRDVPPLTETRV